MSGYTRVDNWLFDEVMPHADPYTYKVVCAVVRKTTGWNRESDEISISQFQQMIGAGSRSTTTKAIQDAIDHGWIEREEQGQGYIYWTITSPETVPASTDNGLSASPDSVPLASPDSVPTKEHSKDKVKGGDPVKVLADHFTNETTIFASADKWAERWQLPLQTIYERAGDLEAAKSLISRAVQFARDGPKRYTITSPMSITTIVANMPLNGHGGTVKVGSR